MFAKLPEAFANFFLQRTVDNSPIKKKRKILPAKVTKKANSAVKKMRKMLSAKKRAREIFAHTTTGSDEEDVSEIDKLKCRYRS